MKKSEMLQAALKHVRVDAGCRDQVVRTLALVWDSGAVAHYLDTVRHHLDFGGCRLLDVGAGACWHAPFYLACGARAVHCLDKYVDVETRHIRWHQGADFTLREMPLSLGAFLGAFASLELIREDIGEFHDRPGQYDAAVMLTVSEHLLDPAAALEAVAGALRPDGRLLLTHGNFYAWQGHHLAPFSVEAYDPADEAQNQLVDWNHVVNRRRFDKRFVELNLIRIHELAALLARHFAADKVEYVKAAPHVARRLTPAIRLRLFEFHEDELLTDLYVFVGRRRDGAGEAAAAYGRTFRVRVAADTYREGHCFLVAIPFGMDAERYALFENGRPLPQRDCLHEDIRRLGDGRYSIWGHTLYFSTSGNRHPLESGDAYELRPLDATL